MSRRTQAQIESDAAEAAAFAQLHRQAAIEHVQAAARRGDVCRYYDPQLQAAYLQAGGREE